MWLAAGQYGTAFSPSSAVGCERGYCNSTTMTLTSVSAASSFCQNQIYCNAAETGDGQQHPAGTSWPLATIDGCFQYSCSSSGVVQPIAVSTHCCLSSAVTGVPQYYSPGSWVPTHSMGNLCVKQQCVFQGATVGSSLVDVDVDQSFCTNSAPSAATNCNVTVNGAQVVNGQVFGDYVQVRQTSGDGFECKRQKCVNGVVIPYPTPNDPNCPPVARQTQTTTATVTTTGPGDQTTQAAQAAANTLVGIVTGDPSDPGRVVVVTAAPIPSPTATLTCTYVDGTKKPQGFQYRIQSNDADKHCVDRICQGGVFLGVPSPSGVTCSTTADVTPFPNNPQSQGFALQGTTTNSYQCTLSLTNSQDASRLETLFNTPTSILFTGTYTAQTLAVINGTTIYTCSNGTVVTDSSQCSNGNNNAASHLAPSLTTLLLGFLVLVSKM